MPRNNEVSDEEYQDMLRQLSELPGAKDVGMLRLDTRMPDLFESETRSVRLGSSRGCLPAGNYTFLEFYCNDPKCDCRRVVLQVREDSDPETLIACINFGWERLAFYKKWMRGNLENAKLVKGGDLDPSGPRDERARAVLNLFKELLMPDEAYVKRLGTHYRKFKGSVLKEQPSSSRWARRPGGGGRRRRLR